MQPNRILFVDDEVNVLQAFRRTLHGKFNCEFVSEASKALQLLERNDDISVIIADMNMPKMNGIELLKIVKDSYPVITRIMLTGNADLMTAVNAVNEGNIFRYLNKPCPNELLIKTIKSAIDHYNLVTAEKELLEKTLKGSINTLLEMFSMINPKAFSIQNQIKKYSMKLLDFIGIKEKWKFEIAFHLSQIGMFSLPPELTDRIYANAIISGQEKEFYRQHPLIGKKIISNIPRLSPVAAIIGAQFMDYSEFNHEIERQNEVIIGAQILRIVTDFVYLLNSGISKDSAIQKMQSTKNIYNEQLLTKLSKLSSEKQEVIYKTIYVRDMLPGMVLDQDIKAKNGLVVLKRNQELNLNIIATLKSFNEGIGIEEPVRISFFL
ncbi:MAG: response regulator [Candidatus Cloacimonetes bacterium]|nr:response regulator [Candidatus Cloacimonadota bacterium]